MQVFQCPPTRDSYEHEQKADSCQNERQPTCQNEVATMAQVLEIVGAGEGNRTLVISLEDCVPVNYFHGLAAKQRQTALKGINGLRLFCKTV
jgi:hypothetical protein